MSNGGAGVRFFMMLFFLLPHFCTAEKNSISNPGHQATLNEISDRAKNLEAKNMNRFSMEALYVYSNVYDSLYKNEKADTLNKINAAFDKASAADKLRSNNLDASLKELNVKKEVLRQKYFGLLRKSVVALIIWLCIIGVVLYLRARTMKRNKALEEESRLALNTYEDLFRNGEALLYVSSKAGDMETELHRLHQSVLASNEKVKEQIKSGEANAPDAKVVQSKVSEILAVVEKQDGIFQALKVQQQEDPEKTETDMNELCRSYLHLASAGMKADQLACKVSTDLEKRLPKIKVHPRAIGTLLSNLMVNAFQSVQAKAASAPKTYQPAVAVSTRVLPRFLQIRLKDNGTGVTDEELENIIEPFYSLHMAGYGAGLGLSEANRIMKELHNGEITIESELGKGTDVYLKFYTGK